MYSNFPTCINLADVLYATGSRVFRIEDGKVVPASPPAEDLARAFTEVTLEAAATVAGALFVAVNDHREPADHLVWEAIGRGATACLVSRLPPRVRAECDHSLPCCSDAYLLLVPNARIAFHRLGARWRRRHDVVVVGITGSVGKTSTKEIVGGLLSRLTPTLVSVQNNNSDTGAALTLMSLTSAHRLAVIEMGLYGLGDIDMEARIARPQIGVITNVGPVHLERLGSLESIARAKSELIRALPDDGFALLNGDDPAVRGMAFLTRARAVLVGRGPECDYRAVDIEPEGLAGLSFVIEAEGRRVPLRVKVPGTHNAYAFLFAAALARTFGIDWETIQDAATLVRLEIRHRVHRVDPRLVVIDDAYNVSPASMRAALELLSLAPGRRVAILGEMLRLGSLEEDAHRQVGRQASGVADWIVLRGERTRFIAE